MIVAEGKPKCAVEEKVSTRVLAKFDPDDLIRTDRVSGMLHFIRGNGLVFETIDHWRQFHRVES